MSAKTYRPFKIDVYGLQDVYLGTLQSYNDNFIGQVENPSVTVSSDGSQKFSCTIPKYYIDPKTNVKTLNPRWGDITNGVLAENTRILKVFIQFDNETKVYPFIIDKITDKRDKSHQVFKQIEGSGLAFAELGKQGYKLELKQELVEEELETNPDLLTNVQYWADKVFPNTKDTNGKITEWLTPWCYEVRMDWSLYNDIQRDNDKVYEDSYVNNWEIDNKNLIPAGITKGVEKCRILDCYNSNKYNITQSIAETFEIFCEYEYKCDAAGRFIGAYTDEDGNAWTGRKVVFYNRAISTENPLQIYYQKNLNTISRSADSSEVYTKLFVKPIESSVMENGYVSIANTFANPTLDDFLLDFDYLHSVGGLTDYQMSFTKEYQASIRRLNLSLMHAAPILEDYVVQINQKKADLSGLDKQTASAKEQLQYYQTLRDNSLTNGVVVRNASNAASCIFTEDTEGYYKASLRFEGINAGSINGYRKSSYTDKVFSSGDLQRISNENDLKGKTGYIVLLDEYGYASALYTTDSSLSIVYLELEYSPKNKYESVCRSFQDQISENETRQTTINNDLTKLNNEYNDYLAAYNEKLAEKDELNLKLERILGPALREGYWTPDSYEDRGKSYIKEFRGGPSGSINLDTTGFYCDTEPFDNEQLSYYYVGSTRKYYPYILLSKMPTSAWSGKDPDNLVLHFQNNYKYTVQSSTTGAFAAGNYFITCNYKNYYFTLTSGAAANTVFTVSIKGDTVSITKGGTPITLQTYLKNASNLTAYFTGAGNESMSDFCAYNNAGFVFAYMNTGSNTYQPVILLNNDSSATNGVYTSRKYISYSFVGESGITYMGEVSSLVNSKSANNLVYPRFYIAEDNVFSASELLTLSLDNAALEKYYDYTVLLRDGKTYITPKFTSNNPIWDISGAYGLTYYSSQANEALYLDARQVSKDYSHPKYSYDLSVSIIHNDDGTMPLVELGQLAYISDPILGVRAASGYVSEITFNLPQPQKDTIKIANYKTKFEDLFHTITVSSEAMKNNKTSYDIAANSFGPDGSISTNVLQQAIDNGNFYFDYSSTGVVIDPTEGIILTNKKPYSNGVYGQVVLQGGGIFVSSEYDSQGNRIWNTSITPQGINASLITAGQLNTDLIKIFSGNQMAFQWNSEGLYAYKFDGNGLAMSDVYIRYNQDGLHYVKEQEDGTELRIVSLDWDGLTLRNNDGQHTMYLDAATGDLNLSGTLKSFNYSPGILGTGWLIDQNGYAEFNDIMVRGTISASVFKYDETTAVGGSLYVAPTMIFDSGAGKRGIEWNGDGRNIWFAFPSPFQIANDGGNTAQDYLNRTWTGGEVLGINGIIQTKEPVEVDGELKKVRFEIKNLRVKISRLRTSSGYLQVYSEVTISSNTQNVFWDEDGTAVPMSEVVKVGSLEAGKVAFEMIDSWHLIYMGTNGKRQGILITAMEKNSPYIDIYDDQSADNTYEFNMAPRVRLGRLDGLHDITEVQNEYDNWGVDKNTGIKGYGLYSDNVYLKGAIYATSGKIGGLTVNQVENLSSRMQDAEGNITTIQQTAEGIEQRVSDAEGNITTINTTIGNIDLSVNNNKENIEDTVTKLGNGGWKDTVLEGSFINVKEEQITIGSKGGIYIHGGDGIQVTSGGKIYIGSKGNIDISSEGKFTIDSTNFKVKSDGSVIISGNITATSGKIGSWNIDTNGRLYSNASGGYIGLSANKDNDGAYRIWAGNSSPASANFWVKEDGEIKATSGTIGGLTIDNIVTGINTVDTRISTSVGDAKNALGQSIKDVEEGVKDGTIPAGALGDNSFIDVSKGTITIGAGKSINIKSGGSVSIASDGAFSLSSTNFTVSTDGTITAKSGTIGGWTIGTNSLYSGSGTAYVALNSDPNNEYRIWAGAETATDASFRVSKNGDVYLGSLYYLDENGANPKKASLTSSLWKYNKAYNNMITAVSSAVSGNAVTLTFTRQYGDPLRVNFNKASELEFFQVSSAGDETNRLINVQALDENLKVLRTATLRGTPEVSSKRVTISWSERNPGNTYVDCSDIYNAGYTKGASDLLGNATFSQSWSGGLQTVDVKSGTTTIASHSTYIGAGTQTLDGNTYSVPIMYGDTAALGGSTGYTVKVDATDRYEAGGVLSGGTSWTNGTTKVTSAGGGSKSITVGIRSVSTSTTLGATTDGTGEATISVYLTNSVSGSFKVSVNAKTAYDEGYTAGFAAAEAQYTTKTALVGYSDYNGGASTTLYYKVPNQNVYSSVGTHVWRYGGNSTTLYQKTSAT